MFVVRWFVRRIGCNCHLCDRRMNFFNELTEDEQKEIVSYFQTRENRQPDTSGIFVCQHCRIVYDDFSGEKKSMEGDNVSICKICGSPSVRHLGLSVATGEIADFRKENPRLVKDYECLNCSRQPYGYLYCLTCDAKVKLVGCRNCYTLYLWKSAKGSKYGLKFLVPLTDEPILKEARDITMGAT